MSSDHEFTSVELTKGGSMKAMKELGKMKDDKETDYNFVPNPMVLALDDRDIAELGEENVI